MSDASDLKSGVAGDNSKTASPANGDDAAAGARTTTENGWDGWPTAPTPKYLVPKMGDVPVSSTVHFQTVAMTDLGTGTSPHEMWARVKDKVLSALNRIASQDLEIRRATWGPAPPESRTDVTRTVKDLFAGTAKGFFLVSNALFGDPAEGTPKKLRIASTWPDGTSTTIWVNENYTVQTGDAESISEAAYGDMLEGDTAPVLHLDVTEKVRSKIRAGRVSTAATQKNFGTPPAGKTLWVEYTLGGPPLIEVVPMGQTLTIGRKRPPTDPDDVYNRYFAKSLSVADAATSLSKDGITAADISPEVAEVLDRTVEDELNALLGIAPEEQLDPVKNATPDSMDTPAVGAILFHEQGWYGRGLALGNLLHSVALAPGEVTQIAMTNWNHSTRGTDSETVSQDDTTTATGHQNRSVSEIQDASLAEHTSGSSSASSHSHSSSSGRSSTSVHASLGFGSVSGGVSGTSSSRGSSSTVSTDVTRSDGNKNLAMEANQKVDSTTKRHAEAARTRRAAVVREVSQSEGETLTTRVLANYNHMHALTMMYFEVIEVFSLETRVVDVERVLFLPFHVRNVEELIPKYRATLIDAANAAGQPGLAQAIRHCEQASSELTELINGITTELETETTNLANIKTQIALLPAKDPERRAEIASSIAEVTAERQAAIAAYIDSPALAAALGPQQLRRHIQDLDEQAELARQQTRALNKSARQELAQLKADLRTAQRRHDDLQEHKNQLEEAQRTLSPPLSAGPLYDNRLFFNQAVWLSLSPGEVLGLARRRNTFQGEPIFEQIDPTPVAVSGNYVGYRWHIDNRAEYKKFKEKFAVPAGATITADIAVPTGGVFGESVLGQAVSAEKIDLSRFWNWGDSPIPILPTSINPLSAVKPSTQAVSTEPGKLADSAAKLDQLQALPDLQGFAALSQTLQAQTFRDMSGQSMLKSLAEATTTAALSGDTEAGQRASDNLKAGLDFIANMADKAVSVATAPETGGGSLLGGMVQSKESGGASLLGGVLNAKDDDGDDDVLSRLSGEARQRLHEADPPPEHENSSPNTPSSAGQN